MKVESISTIYTEETGINGFERVMEKIERNGVVEIRPLALRVPKDTLTSYCDSLRLSEGDQTISFHFYTKGCVYRYSGDTGKIVPANKNTAAYQNLMAMAKSIANLNYVWEQLRAKGAVFLKEVSGRNSYIVVDGKLFSAHCSETYDRLLALKAIHGNGKITRRKFPLHAFGDRMSYVQSLVNGLIASGVVK